MDAEAEGLIWLVLVHAIPPKPSYLRVKFGRKVQKLGSVAIKNSVYALPLSDQGREDFAWLAKEIARAGGDASVMEASFVEGLSNGEVKALFQAARDAEYREAAAPLRKAAARARRPAKDAARRPLHAALERCRKRVQEIAAVDFFASSGREAIEALIKEVEARLKPVEPAPSAPPTARTRPRAATWVTRTGIHVDRMACAWLIRRFIDPRAKLRFVSAKQYEHQPGELRFDMFDGEFTHEGDACSFEVLLRRFQLESDPGLVQLAQLVHDVDLKDEKFGRPDTVGFERLIAAIAMAHPSDEERLSRATQVLDDLYLYFSRKGRTGRT